jgi:hypothetical protein
MTQCAWTSLRVRSARALAVVTLALAALAALPSPASAQWIEVKSTNFTVVSNAGDRGTRKIVWQLEQMRSAMKAIWTWVKPDLNRPLTVILVKDESSMRQIAPEYWEKRGGVRPASLWLSGADQYYLVLRSDVEVDDQATTNPFISAYFSYASLVLDQSLSRALPFWFRRGLSGVLSNTIVRDDRILLGPVIPAKLAILRDRPRLPIAKLLEVTTRSPEVRQGDFLQVYDAQTWALMHMFMFGDEGKHAPRLDAFITQVSAGSEPTAAFTATIGPVESVEAAFRLYFERNLFSYRQINVDMNVERERIPVRPLTAPEAASLRALFHATMRRPVESRAAIAEARKEDPNAAGSYTAEGLLSDQEDKDAEAKAAYTKAVELGTTSSFAYYRLATLTWQPNASAAVLAQIETLLSGAIKYNVRYASAYAWLGELREVAKSDTGIALIRRAIALEPQEPNHRLRAAYVLGRQGKAAEARAEAQAALTLADDDAERKRAQDMLDRLAKM